MKLADESSHLQSNEQKHGFKKTYSETFRKDKNNINEPSLNKPTSHEENGAFSRVIRNLTDKRYTSLNPKLDQADDSVRRIFGDRKKV